MVGTIITTIGTLVTLYMAYKAKSYKDQIAVDLRRLNLLEALDFLKRAQDNSRKLLNHINKNIRGTNRDQIIDKIQENIDRSLMCIDPDGPDSGLREIILNAQDELIEIRKTNSINISESVKQLHFLIQESVIATKSKSQKLIGE